MLKLVYIYTEDSTVDKYILLYCIVLYCIVTSIYERAYERDPRKRDNTRFVCVLMRGILISTPIQAYMSVLMRFLLISTLNTRIYERAYERDSHKHAEYN